MGVMTRWREADPDIREHFAEFERYEEIWVSGSTAGERAEFLSQGASLCVSRGVPGELWVWFWRDVYGPVLDGDLSHWPRLIAEAPEVTEGQDWFGCLMAAVVAR